MINFYDGSNELALCGEKLKFKISDSPNFSHESHSVNFIHIIHPMMEEVAEANSDPLETVLTGRLTGTDLPNESGQAWEKQERRDVLTNSGKRQPHTAGMQCRIIDNSRTKDLPSVVQAPNLKLKPLSDHRGYPFLGHINQRPVIIPAKLAKGRWVATPKNKKKLTKQG